MGARFRPIKRKVMATQSRDKSETLVGCEVETDYSILEAIAGFDILYPFFLFTQA